ncbi:unnamed protein product [Fraxinus pennsylvanica]|uniref:F-box domain-containing protein n=1 Tax=Fraxinus pennsylvanica TaxID=56036 RepID=A0AAD1YVU2_9LAMI|nr:unnamed protein product [Fraxinus pennsylvanica]
MNMELIPGLPYDVGLECLIRVPYNHFSSVASVCRNWSHQINEPEFWRHRKSAGLTQKVIIMAQARTDSNLKLRVNKYSGAPVYRLTLFEPKTGYWAELPMIPEYSDGLPMFCHVVGVGVNLVVIGGWNSVTWEVLNTVFIYNFASATWRRGTDMPGCRRSFFACASDSDRMVFVAGGHDTKKRAMKSAMAYDLLTNTWVLLPDMARECDESKGVIHRGKFHVIGGYHTSMQGRFECSAEEFDVTTWQWGPVQEDFLNTATCPRNCVDGGNMLLYMPRETIMAARQGSTWQDVAELPADVRRVNLVVIGGWNSVTWEVLNTVFIYNFASATWRRGGHDTKKRAMKSAMAYDLLTNTWVLLPDMARECDESKGVIHRGKFHVIGGYHTSMQGRFECSAEEFDVTTWQWGPVQEDFLNTATCPRNCVDGGNMLLYMPRETIMAARQGSTWQDVAELPADVRSTSYMTAWQGNLFVIGSGGFGAPHKGYLLDLKSYKWEKVDIAENFSGHVRSGCCLKL